MSLELSPLSESVQQQLFALARALGGPLLSLDTSSAVTSFCLVHADHLDEQFLPAGVVPSESLVQALDARLRARVLAASDLKAIVIGVGPGSFTGLRVGLATVKGLAFGAGVPVIGVSSLGLWAAAAAPDEHDVPNQTKFVLTVLDARRGDVFAALYRVQHNGHIGVVIDDGVYTPDILLQYIKDYSSNHGVACVGDGSSICLDVVNRSGAQWLAHVTPRAALGLVHASHRLTSSVWDDLNTLTPRYLRLSEAERQLLSSF